ncbi:MAG: response regulator transcription factor [Clostridia bacterium]
MPRILIADDEERIRKIVKEYALFNGYEVVEAKNGFEAVELVRNRDFDVVVLDIMMPGLDGYSACKEIRKIKKVPVLMLSARGEEYDKLFGFELGIDDYVVKPFSPKELMMRINVIIQRNRKAEGEEEVLQFEGLRIDLSGRDVFLDGEKAMLTPKEFEMLALMAKNRNRVFTRSMILDKVWGYSAYVDDRTIDTHIKTLRNSLGVYRRFIVTARGAGYKFET